MVRKNEPWKKLTALLIVGVGAADAEYTRVLEHWYFLLSTARPHIIFERHSDTGNLKACVKNAQLMQQMQSQLIVGAITGTFLGIISNGTVQFFPHRTPEAGRVYHLIPMAQA